MARSGTSRRRSPTAGGSRSRTCRRGWPTRLAVRPGRPVLPGALPRRAAWPASRPIGAVVKSDLRTVVFCWLVDRSGVESVGGPDARADPHAAGQAAAPSLAGQPGHRRGRPRRHDRRPHPAAPRRAAARRGSTRRAAAGPAAPRRLLPRRRLGARQPAELRRRLQPDRGSGRRGRRLGRLPDGTRASHAGRRRRRLRRNGLAGRQRGRGRRGRRPGWPSPATARAATWPRSSR